jgi:hypothetical protein
VVTFKIFDAQYNLVNLFSAFFSFETSFQQIHIHQRAGLKWYICSYALIFNDVLSRQEQNVYSSMQHINIYIFFECLFIKCTEFSLFIINW